MRATPAPFFGSVLLAGLGGLAGFFSFPGYGLWYLAPISLGLLFASLWVKNVWLGFLSGLVYGLVFFLLLLQWTNIYVGDVPWIALSTLQALYIAVLGLFSAFLFRVRGPGWLASLGFAGLWVGQEALRGATPFGGFPWAKIAFSQADSPVLSLAALGGTPLVGFLVAFVGALLGSALLIGAGHAQPAFGRLRLVWFVAVAAVLMFAGQIVPIARDAENGTLNVAGIQGNVSENGLTMGRTPREVLENHARVTERLAATGAEPDLVIWPENASDIDPAYDVAAYDRIDSAIESLGAPALVGIVRYQPEPYRQNISLLWQPGEGPVDKYVKQRPVPFAEYIPYRDFFRRFSDKVDLVTMDMIAGKELGVFDVAGTRVGDVICFEIAYDDLIHDTVRAGSEILVVQTNNATFGRTDESVQQLAMSRVRAVETGRSVAHISTVGVSALITPDGRQVVTGEHWEPEALVADLPLRTSLTMATRLGNIVPATLISVGLAVLLRSMVASRRFKRGLKRPEASQTRRGAR